MIDQYLHVVCKVMFFHYMGFEAMRNLIKVVLPYTTNEATRLESKEENDE